VLAGGGALPIATGADATGLPSPDAALLAACEALPRLRDAVCAWPDDMDLNDDNPIWRDYCAAIDFITDATPRTLAGWMAKAEAARQESLTPAGAEEPEGTHGAYWSWQLMHDMRALVAAGVVR
jgi:hypothetical protein